MIIKWDEIQVREQKEAFELRSVYCPYCAEMKVVTYFDQDDYTDECICYGCGMAFALSKEFVKLTTENELNMLAAIRKGYDNKTD